MTALDSLYDEQRRRYELLRLAAIARGSSETLAHVTALDAIEDWHIQSSQQWSANGWKADNDPQIAVALPIEWAEAIEAPYAEEELVEGIVPAGSFIVLFGPSGSGKTFVALDLSGHGASNRAWHGRRVHKSIVLYVAAEAGKGIRNRLLAWRQHYSVDELPVAIITQPVNVRAPFGDVDRIIQTCAGIAAEQGPVGLIVIDTLSRAFGGGDENSSEDMGALVANVDRIRFETGAAVLLVHHAGKDASKGARGHSLLRAAADVEIEVANSDGIVSATITKHRDGTVGATIAAKLRPIEIGINAWGDPLATCVLEPLNGVPAAVKARKLPKGSESALRALKDAIGDQGQAMPGTSAIPPGVRAVTGKAWRERYYAIDTLDADGDGDVKREREARKQRFTRARKALLDAGFVNATNDWHWIV